MRPHGRGDLESLYFTYPAFHAGETAEQRGIHEIHPVVIAGAGPVGMTAALALARHGVRSVIVEKKNTFNDGSRAICLSRSSFRILDDLGAVAPFAAKALGWTRGRAFYRGTEVHAFEMPHTEHDKYLPMYNLQQQYIEQYLWEACRASPLIDLRWQSEVTGLTVDDETVSLTIAAPGGGYTLSGRYLIAADGARSTIRGLRRLRLQGQNLPGSYIIADVKMADDAPAERRAFFDSPGNPGGTVLVHRQPGDIWRIDYQLRADESSEEALKEHNIRARVQAILSDIGHHGPWDLEWWSLYSANTLCLDEYRHGRVIFAGDSAHIVPIFGVRGLNNGLADADNLGWKLAYVLNGIAGPRLLDSYTPERRGATLDVFANAARSARFMAPPSPGWQRVREAVLSLALSETFPREFANPRQMQPYSYAASPLTPYPLRDRGFRAGAHSGAAMNDTRLADGGFLMDRAGKGFTLLLFARHAPGGELAGAIARMTAIDPFFTVLIVSTLNSSLPEAIDDPGGIIAHNYDAKAGTAYLIRPDRHVAGRWKTVAPAELLATFNACLGRSA